MLLPHISKILSIKSKWEKLINDLETFTELFLL